MTSAALGIGISSSDARTMVSNVSVLSGWCLMLAQLTDVNHPKVCSACAEGVLKEGFTTATSGSGTWGTFEFDIAFNVERAGPVLLSVYEISPENGMRINETTVPLEVEP